MIAVNCLISALDSQQRARLLDRTVHTDPAVERTVRAIIDDVRVRGDDALREMAARFDDVELASLEIPATMWRGALERTSPGVRDALVQAASNLANFHRAQLPAPIELQTMRGITLGRRADALRSVGVYAPGGTASYPSSVLMGVVPARVAAVDSVIVCSPPGPDGTPPDAVLAACAIAGADRLFAVGGAGAIAAMTFGTASIPRVDRIVGPGNAYVAEAKRQVNGSVAIDSPAGPSEILIIADESADPSIAAAEIVAQAEHDANARCVLVTTSQHVLEMVATTLSATVPTQPRAAIITRALAENGALLLAADIDEALAFASAYAPEHLLLLTREPRAVLAGVRCAGTVFLGPASSVAFGDYITGANHVLPTGGTARSWSGLSTADFLRFTTWQQLDDAAASACADPTVTLAAAEGLPAHAAAARLRAMPSTRATPREVQFRDAYRGLNPYDPGRSPCTVDLCDNTNLFGAPPAALVALQSVRTPTITRYPDTYASELKRALARWHGVAPANIATGCGSDDVIDSTLRAFCDVGATVAHPDPTFGMVPAFARMNAARPIAVRLRDDMSLDADALLAAFATVTYLCRPNNPTGTAYERAATLRVCENAAGLVLVDEAYADFAEDDVVAYAAASQRTVVLRTLSKAWGMAGLRIGYAVGPEKLIAEIEKSRGPYKVSATAEAAATAALTRDTAWMQERVRLVRQARSRLRAELQARDVHALESAANFVLARVRGCAATWDRELRVRGVAVRPFPALPGLGECLRITVGPWPMLEHFLDAFDDVSTSKRELTA